MLPQKLNLGYKYEGSQSFLMLDSSSHFRGAFAVSSNHPANAFQGPASPPRYTISSIRLAPFRKRLKKQYSHRTNLSYIKTSTDLKESILHRDTICKFRTGQGSSGWTLKVQMVSPNPSGTGHPLLVMRVSFSHSESPGKSNQACVPEWIGDGEAVPLWPRPGSRP